VFALQPVAAAMYIAAFRRTPRSCKLCNSFPWGSTLLVTTHIVAQKIY
jgi:ribosome biogenesis protein Tsr3